jgi:hypothetical protein
MLYMQDSRDEQDQDQYLPRLTPPPANCQESKATGKKPGTLLIPARQTCFETGLTGIPEPFPLSAFDHSASDLPPPNG